MEAGHGGRDEKGLKADEEAVPIYLDGLLRAVHDDGGVLWRTRAEFVGDPPAPQIVAITSLGGVVIDMPRRQPSS